MWEVETTAEAERWLMSLPTEDFARIAAAIDLVAERGPMLGRPTVDRVAGSRHHNMKEIRSRGGNLRVLFAFDPNRTAILLVGGDKTHEWTDWYDRNIPIADDLYDRHLSHLS